MTHSHVINPVLNGEYISVKLQVVLDYLMFDLGEGGRLNLPTAKPTASVVTLGLGFKIIMVLL